MLYELIGIVRTGSQNEVKDIMMGVGRTVLNGSGVIRSIDNWGVFALPRAISRSQTKHHNGHYFVMRYDLSTRGQEDLRKSLRDDVRVLRTTSVKLGDGKLETLSKFGQLNWKESL